MEYARNFMEYLNQKRNIPFEVHAFSSAEMFLEFAKNNETEILLISDKAMKEEIRRYPIRQIIILSEGVHSPVLDQYPAVYKYQSSEKVIREVMACYGVENGVDTSPALLPIQGVENLVRLEAKEANLESGTEITIRDLIRAALRMRPNRVIIGEVRGAETFELLSALNTGHAGSLSTAHANSVKDMISRLETMVLMGVQLPLEAIRRQIASGIEILVHLGRGEDGSRRVEEIAEITGMEEDEIKTVSLFRREYGRGLQKTGELVHREKLEGKTG